MPVQFSELPTISSDPAAIRYRGRRFHIIMLDSDAAVRSKLRRTLSGRFTVTLLSHPDDLALHISKSPIPVLVLLDWFAGQDSTGKTALGLLQAILTARPYLPMVVVSI